MQRPGEISYTIAEPRMSRKIGGLTRPAKIHPQRFRLKNLTQNAWERGGFAPIKIALLILPHDLASCQRDQQVRGRLVSSPRIELFLYPRRCRCLRRCE